jgi:hypothetical protein
VRGGGPVVAGVGRSFVASGAMILGGVVALLVLLLAAPAGQAAYSPDLRKASLTPTDLPGEFEVSHSSSANGGNEFERILVPKGDSAEVFIVYESLLTLTCQKVERFAEIKKVLRRNTARFADDIRQLFMLTVLLPPNVRAKSVRTLNIGDDAWETPFDARSACCRLDATVVYVRVGRILYRLTFGGTQLDRAFLTSVMRAAVNRIRHSS